MPDSPAWMEKKSRARQLVRDANPALNAQESARILGLVNRDIAEAVNLFDDLKPDEVAVAVKDFLEDLKARAAGARSSADRTGEWLRNLSLPDSVPSFQELSDVFKAGVYGSQRVKLPISDQIYAQLTGQNTDWHNWVEPVSHSGASGLAVLVDYAVSMQVEQPGSELIHPTFIDNLFYEVIKRMANADMPISVPVKRERDTTEHSSTVQSQRPNFMLLVNDALLFKGEDKTDPGDMPMAKRELAEKMADWSGAYHGTVEYMLCYAAAGLRFQLCAMQCSSPGQPATVVDIMPEFLLSNPFDRLRTMHAALVTYSIIAKQYAQLPKDHRPYGVTISRPRGCSLQYFGSFVLKCVELEKDDLLRRVAERMKGIYDAASGCDYIIQGSDLRISRGKYNVRLSPVATPLSGPPSLEHELAAAVRCILSALQCLHRINWGHGDLRWPNVVVEHAGKYRVIDLESVVQLGSRPELTPLPRAWGYQAEALDQGVFTARSDLYMVGKMIQQSPVLGPGAVLADKLMGKQLTLDEALRDVWVDQVAAVGDSNNP